MKSWNSTQSAKTLKGGFSMLLCLRTLSVKSLKSKGLPQYCGQCKRWWYRCRTRQRKSADQHRSRHRIHDIKAPCRITRPAGCLLSVSIFCSVYYTYELLLRLLYTPTKITATTDTASRTNHKARLLLSPVCMFVVVSFFELLSVVLATDFV